MASNSTDAKKLYEEIIKDVCKNVREALRQEGYDDQTSKELEKTWLDKLSHSRALEPVQVSAVDQALTRQHGRSATGDATNNKSATSVAQKPNQMYQSSFIPTQSATAMSSLNSQGQTQFPRLSYPTPTNIGNGAMKAPGQLDGAIDELSRKKKSKKTIEICLQVDGTGPPMGDEDDDDDDSEVDGNDAQDDMDDDDDDDINEEGREDPNPLCSDDDVSDDEPEKLFETENIVLCQYDKITRTKNKWRFNLKSGVMHLEGHDYVFSKANGEADW